MIVKTSVDLRVVKLLELLLLLRKEVIQPHLPIRLPCYDFTPIIGPTFDGSFPVRGSGFEIRLFAVGETGWASFFSFPCPFELLTSNLQPRAGLGHRLRVLPTFVV